MNDHTQQQLEQRIVELETKQAFMEDAISEQTQEIRRLLGQLSRMQVQISYLANKVKATEPANIASQREETPPPHY